MKTLLGFLLDQLLRQRWDIRRGYSAWQLLRFLGAFGNLPSLISGSCSGDTTFTAVFTGENLRNTPPLSRFFNCNVLQKTSSFLIVNREFLRNTFEIRETLSHEFDKKHNRHIGLFGIFGIIFY